jgi:hypothetical protein
VRENPGQVFHTNCEKRTMVVNTHHAMHRNQQGVCHTVALPFTLKKYLKAKEELRKFKYNPQKKSSERNQNPSRYHNSIITNLKFQHKSKYHLSRILI